MSENEIVCDECGRIREISDSGPCAGCGGRTFSTAKSKNIDQLSEIDKRYEDPSDVVERMFHKTKEIINYINREDSSCLNDKMLNKQFDLFISEIRSNTEAIRQFSVSVHCLAESITALVNDVLNSKYPDDKPESISNYLNGKSIDDN